MGRDPVRLTEESDSSLAVKGVAVQMAWRDCPSWRRIHRRRLERRRDEIRAEVRERKLARGGTD